MATPAQEPSFVQVVADFIQQGGPFMYVILVVLAVGLAVALERYIYLSAVKSKNAKIWAEVFPVLSKGQFKQALDMCKDNNSAIARILTAGLTRTAVARRSDEIELAMEEGLMEVVPRLEARTPYIATFANIATLLGLLGTIMGLIAAFAAVAAADPAEKANLLSESISVAMNTTAFGLIAAIPMLLAFAVLQAKTGKVVDSLEMVSVKFLNVYRQVSAAAAANKSE